MEKGECRRTRRGVVYCYIPELGVRFCPRGTTSVRDCSVRSTGDRRRGRWEVHRRRIAAPIEAYI